MPFQCSLQPTLLSYQAEICWQIHEEAFQKQHLTCAQNQRCFDRETFFEAMYDPEWSKFIVTNEKNEIVGFSLGSFNLEKASIAYFNPTRIEKFFPAEYKGKIFYVTTIAIKSAFKRRHKLFLRLVESLENYVCQVNLGIVAYDFSEKIPLLEMIEHALEISELTQPVIESGIIGVQTYAFTMTKPAH